MGHYTEKHIAQAAHYLLARVVPLEFHSGVELHQSRAVEHQNLPLHELHGRVLWKQLELVKLKPC